MVNKKAYIRTLEAIIAIVIFLIFISSALIINKVPQREKVPNDIKLLQDTILNNIETDLSLRQCLVNNDVICINNSIKKSIISDIEYDFEICNEPNPTDCILTKTFPADRKIYSDSLIVQEDNSAIFRLFLWRKVV